MGNTKIFIIFSVYVIFFFFLFRCFSNSIYLDVGISWFALIFHGMFPWAVCQSRANFCLENITIVSRLVLLCFLRFMCLETTNHVLYSVLSIQVFYQWV